MPVLTRPRPATTDARTKLAEAHASLAAAQAAIQEAEAAHDDAAVDYRRAKNAVSDIEERMSALAARWSTATPGLREDLQIRYDECRPALAAAKLPLMPLGVEVEKAESHVAKAQQRLSFDQSRLHDAAVVVVKDEVPAIVAPMVEQIEAAFATILLHGPNLFFLINNRLLSADVLDPNISRLLNISTTEWPAFKQRFSASPWRNVTAALEQNAEAGMPAGPAA